jgi:hypothetical protein
MRGAAMQEIRSALTRLRSDPSLAKVIYAATLISALLVLVLVIKGPEEQGRLITDRNGDVVSIRRHSVTSSERYDMTLITGDGDSAGARDVTIELRGSPQAAKTADDSSTETAEAETDAEIDRILTEIEYAEGDTIELPSELTDGTPVTWKARKQDDSTGIALIPILYIAVIAAAVKTSLDRQSDSEKTARKEIMKGLPRFCNQLFLMMNAGMILSDAFAKICESYARYGEDGMSIFERDLTQLRIINEGTRKSTASMISEYAARHNVKELVRIATILTENERRGSDVIESLSRESKYLWDERKIVARESGRMIDMKMSWPLAMLLILLIVITMAPALLSM